MGGNWWLTRQQAALQQRQGQSDRRFQLAHERADRLRTAFFDLMQPMNALALQFTPLEHDAERPPSQDQAYVAQLEQLVQGLQTQLVVVKSLLGLEVGNGDLPVITQSILQHQQELCEMVDNGRMDPDHLRSLYAVLIADIGELERVLHGILKQAEEAAVVA